MKDEMEYLDKDRFGFIAQEIMEVFPELVKHDEEIDQYSVDYMGIIPILVEAVKDQQEIIESLQDQLNSISKEGAVKSTTGFTSETPEAKALNELFQNSPNPFSEATTIRYSLEEAISSAYINLYDMTGKQLKSFKLHHSGEIDISGGELNPGMYMYTLIADGQVISSKQMILTD